MPRLIWVFAGRTCHFVSFVMLRLIYCTIAVVHVYYVNLPKISLKFFFWILQTGFLFFRQDGGTETEYVENQSNGDITEDTYSLLQNRRKETILFKEYIYNIFSWKNEHPTYLTETLASYEILLFCKYNFSKFCINFNKWRNVRWLNEPCREKTCLCHMQTTEA